MAVREEQLDAFYRSLLPIAVPADSDQARSNSTYSGSSRTALNAIAAGDRSRWVIRDAGLVQRAIQRFRAEMDAVLAARGPPVLEELVGVKNYAKMPINHANETEAGERLARLLDVVIELADTADDALHAASARQLRKVAEMMVRTSETYLKPDYAIVERSLASGSQFNADRTRVVFETKAVLADLNLFLRVETLMRSAGYVNINGVDDNPVKSLLEKITASAQRARTSNFFFFCGRSWIFGQIVPFDENGQAGFDVLLSPMETLVQPRDPASNNDIYRSFMLVVLSCLYDDLIYEPEGKDTLLQKRRDELLESYRDRHIAWSKKRSPSTLKPSSEDDSEVQKSLWADPSYRSSTTRAGEGRRPMTRSHAASPDKSQSQSDAGASISGNALAQITLEDATLGKDSFRRAKSKKPVSLTLLDSANVPLHPAWANMHLISGTLSRFTDPDDLILSSFADQTLPLRPLSSFPNRTPSREAISATRSPDSALYTPPNTPLRVVEYLHHLCKQLRKQYVQAIYPTPHSGQVVFTGPYGLGLVDESEARIDYVVKLARKRPASTILQQGDLEYELGIMTGALRDNPSDVVPLVAAFEQTTDLGGREPYLALVSEYRGKAPLSWPDLPIEIRYKLYISLLRLHQHFGVVHGDVAPRNVVVDTAGNARWIDFGQAVTGHECRGRECPELRTALKEMGLREHRRELSQAVAEEDLTT